MIRMRVTVALGLLLLLVVAGCSGKKEPVTISGSKMEVPQWYAEPPVQNDQTLVSVATATSRDLQTAVDKAKQDGRTELARQLEIRVDGMSKRFVEETGLAEDAELLDMFTQVNRSIVSDSLIGSHLTQQELGQEGSIYRAYVMMEMPIGEASARMMERIKNQERLYTRFRASEAFDELDKMVQEYEDWKQKQAGGTGDD